MTQEEALRELKQFSGTTRLRLSANFWEALNTAIKALEQEPCEMTVEEYRQRMIQAFHNADCDSLIAIVSLPSEKEFEHLEWLLQTHYKKEPILDKIRAEIEDLTYYCCEVHPRNVIDDVLEIIDKYKAESEEV